MTVKRANLLADFTFHAPGEPERAFTAGERNLPPAAYAAAKARGLLGPDPAAPKAAPKAKTPAKAKARAKAKAARGPAKA